MGGGGGGAVNDCLVHDCLKEFRMEAWPLPLCRNCVSKCFGAMFSGCLLNSFWIVLRLNNFFLDTLWLTQAVVCFGLSLLFSCHPYLTPLEYAGKKVSQEQEIYYSNPKWNPCEKTALIDSGVSLPNMTEKETLVLLPPLNSPTPRK